MAASAPDAAFQPPLAVLVSRHPPDGARQRDRPLAAARATGDRWHRTGRAYVALLRDGRSHRFPGHLFRGSRQYVCDRSRSACRRLPHLVGVTARDVGTRSRGRRRPRPHWPGSVLCRDLGLGGTVVRPSRSESNAASGHSVGAGVDARLSGGALELLSEHPRPESHFTYASSGACGAGCGSGHVISRGALPSRTIMAARLEYPSRLARQGASSFCGRSSRAPKLRSIITVFSLLADTASSSGEILTGWSAVSSGSLKGLGAFASAPAVMNS